MTTPFYVDDGRSDGTVVGRSSGKVGFYGTTPIAIKSLAQQTTKTTTQLRSELSALQNALASYGLITVT